jgi:uncharacterized membrane protein
MSDQSQEIAGLHVTLRQLTERIEHLEQVVARLAPEPQAPEQSVPVPERAAEPTAPTEPPRAEPWAYRRAPAQPATPAPAPTQAAEWAQPPVLQPPPPPRPPSPPFDWGKLAEQLFAARTLAWAGGVATALGIVLLFVMAASRGWITPSMRVGIGVLVSLGLLGAAVELDRRKWRSDAILAAAGVAIAGLYASLWAATSLYHLVSSQAAAPLAALVAAIAVAVAIRIKQEPLALFGMSAAMLAPLLVSLDVTTGGVLFGAVMVAASFPLLVRFGWRHLVTAVWAIGLAETLGLLGRSWQHLGFGGPVIAAAVMAVLFVTLTFLLELLPADRSRLTVLGSLTGASAFTISLSAAFFFGGVREVSGHSLSGITLAGLAAVWALVAAIPVAARRPHADLTDGLVGFALASAAIATGLLAGGPALVCAWTAESAMLVLLAERIRRRSSTRGLRAIVSAAVYLLLGIMATLDVLQPLPQKLPHIGAGSHSGSIALVAVTLAGIALCFGLRWLKKAELAAAWLVPALALGFLPLWAVAAEWAVVAYAGMAAALLIYRRSPLLVSWMPEWVCLEIASAWWVVGVIVALVVTAPVSDLVLGWSHLGERHGLAGLGALLASAVVFTWSVRRPARVLSEYGLLVPVAMLGFVIAESLPTPYAIWAWLVAAGALAAVVQVRPIRLRLTVDPLLVGSASLLVVGVVSAWAFDDSLTAIVDHGTTAGWESIAIATGAAFLLALAIREPSGRSHALWLPFLLAAQLCTMLLPGQYPLVAVAGLSALASVAALTWPSPVRGRLDRVAVSAIGIGSSAALALVVLLVYETPSMLFQTSHTPAAGLAAALATTAALVLAAGAARHVSWSAGRVSVATLAVYTGGAFALWTLAAAILGAEQLLADAGAAASVHDHFQQGHVLVSISWVLVGLGLVVLSLRGNSRGLRVGGITLLFVALGKLFVYDLAFLTAMARAVSFIVTGSVLLLAALLLQRFAPQVKAALGDEPPEAMA